MTSSFVDFSHFLQADTPTPTGAQAVMVEVLEATGDPPANRRRRLNVTRLSLTVYQDGCSIERAQEEFRFIVLPLRITGRDGSPVRAVAGVR